MRKEIQTAAHNGDGEEKRKLSNIEEPGGRSIDQEGVISGERVGVVNVQELDTEKEKAAGSNERVLLPIRRLPFEKVGRHDDDTLQQETEQ